MSFSPFANQSVMKCQSRLKHSSLLWRNHISTRDSVLSLILLGGGKFVVIRGLLNMHIFNTGCKIIEPLQGSLVETLKAKVCQPVC